MESGSQSPHATPEGPVDLSPPTATEDKVSTFSIISLIAAFFLPLIGLILSIVGIRKAKRLGSNSNRKFALASLAVSLAFLAIYTVGGILIWNSAKQTFDERKAQEAAVDKKLSDYGTVTPEMFAEITTGQTKQEVSDIVGTPPARCKEGSTDSGAKTEVCVWGKGIALDEFIEITFDSDVVVTKTKTGF